MLRPATPLTVIFLVAFALLLLSTISTPIIKGIPLGSYGGYNFGVFGYCKGSSDCSAIGIGYSTDGLFSNGDFSLPSSTRHSLSSILIVHPIAAFLTLVCLCLAAAAHFHGPSSSPRYLLALFILTIPTLLITLLAFLVDILLFIPHMQWGGWITLAATILIVASVVISCAMRRTLVSRQAQKRRIAENADMSGANYYENLQQNRMMSDQLPRADSPPPMSAEDKGIPQYAAFEMSRPETTGTQSRDGGDLSPQDDRAPLNPGRDASIRSAGSAGRRGYVNGGAVPPMPGRPSMDSQGRPRRPSTDQYGNPAPMAMAAEFAPPNLRHQGSQGSLGSERSYGSRGRGRGGYGPPPRGYAGSRGGYAPRGSYGPRGRGGPPPPGWNGRGRGGYGPPPQGMQRGPPPPRPPPPTYGNTGTYADYGGVPIAGAMPRSESPRMQQDPYVAGPDLPIGQAIEMDERSGTISPNSPGYMSPPYGLRDSDADVNGMVGLQQDRRASPMRQRSTESGAPHSPTSIYSSDQSYTAPRSQWAQPEMPPPQQRQYMTSPLNNMESSNRPSMQPMPSSQALGLSPIEASPPTPQNNFQSPMPQPLHKRAGSEPYYEDVDPRFAVEEPSDDGYQRDSALPTALTPGGTINPGVPGGYMSTPHALSGAHQGSSGYGFPNRMQSPNHNPDFLHPPQSRAPRYVGGGGAGPGTNDPSSGSEPQPPMIASASDLTPSENSNENLPEGARSPNASVGGSERASEASHFTSISERPVNPNWRPNSAMGASSRAGSVAGGGPLPPRGPRREDVILGANPDFALPGVGVGRPGRGRGGSRGAMAASNLAGGMTPGGRYPTDLG